MKRSKVSNPGSTAIRNPRIQMSKIKSKNSKTGNILRKDVSPIEVGKYYLKVELSRIFPGKARGFIEKGVEGLNNKEFWRLLEALSFSHRLNSVFWCVSDNSYSWSEERIQTRKVMLTGMTKAINKTIYSKEIDQDPLKFHDFLIKYFEKYKNEDPKKLGQLRPKEKSIVYPRILIKEEEGKLYIIDGMNRYIAQLLRGEKKILVFVGRKSREGKQRIGDSSFLLLRKAYKKGNEEEKKAVLVIAEKLMKMSSDGKGAVRDYWVEHIRDDKETKEAGLLLLKKAKRKK